MEYKNNLNELLDEIRGELETIVDINANPESDLLSFRSGTTKTVLSTNIDTEALKESENSETTKTARFVNVTAAQNIDEDIQRMRIDLKESYELFKTIGDALETINFGNIKSRIKDLHLYPEGSEFEEGTTDPLQTTRLPELTKVMEGKFRQHPGEFADITEVSSFFRTCSQLEHGLQKLGSHRNSMQDLKKRVDWAGTISSNRAEEIKRVLNLE